MRCCRSECGFYSNINAASQSCRSLTLVRFNCTKICPDTANKQQWHTPYAVGFLIGVLIMMSQMFLTLFAVFVGFVNEEDIDGALESDNRAMAFFAFILFLVYVSFIHSAACFSRWFRVARFWLTAVFSPFKLLVLGVNCRVCMVGATTGYFRFPGIPP